MQEKMIDHNAYAILRDLLANDVVLVLEILNPDLVDRIKMMGTLPKYVDRSLFISGKVIYASPDTISPHTQKQVRRGEFIDNIIFHPISGDVLIESPLEPQEFIKDRIELFL